MRHEMTRSEHHAELLCLLSVAAFIFGKDMACRQHLNKTDDTKGGELRYKETPTSVLVNNTVETFRVPNHMVF